MGGASAAPTAKLTAQKKEIANQKRVFLAIFFTSYLMSKIINNIL
jgi:hypothetical protein